MLCNDKSATYQLLGSDKSATYQLLDAYNTKPPDTISRWQTTTIHLSHVQQGRYQFNEESFAKRALGWHSGDLSPNQFGDDGNPSFILHYHEGGTGDFIRRIYCLRAGVTRAHLSPLAESCVPEGTLHRIETALQLRIAGGYENARRRLSTALSDVPSSPSSSSPALVTSQTGRPRPNGGRSTANRYAVTHDNSAAGKGGQTRLCLSQYAWCVCVFMLAQLQLPSGVRAG
ncbi:hypothetical protein CEXT_125781 [Caerostris extrusa]|uniref:Uncharacterized protein n=1 Tax=Caerostris extrusa TaxID=172846 RepID=A0AAV4M5D7_CAEEX|nr:hypothetical protein CEXT_125781 [Caerostris extrusa]